MAELAAVIASTHHPFYYRASTADRRRPAAVRRRVGAQGRGVPGDADRGPSPTCWSWSAATTSTSCGWTTCRSSSSARRRSYDANWYNEEREFGLPRMTLRGQEDLAGAHPARRAWTRDFDLAFSNELRIDHSITCPIITLRPQADLPIVPIYTNIFAPPLPQPKRFVAARARRIRRAGRVLAAATSGSRSSAPGTCRWSWAGPRQFGAARARTRSSTARRSSGSPPATSRAAWPR